MQQLPKRLASIDVLRAITMLLMIFVNDAGGLRQVPEWIDHAKGFEDRMGFADTIFPAFLFIVGLSLPFAIRNRLKKGDSSSSIILYIVGRSAALIIMGLYNMNLEDYSNAAILPRAIWGLVMIISFFLIWLDYPETMNKAKKYTLMGTGIALLIALAIIYKGTDDGGHPVWMHQSWGGILGIIGWSYLVSALVYFLVKGRLGWLIAVYVFFAGANILFHTVLTHAHLYIVGDASSVTLVMGGVVISEVYAYLTTEGKTQRLWAILTAAGVFFLVLGFIIRPYAQGISKIRSTPPWVFICSGITILAFEILLYVVDVQGKKDWFKIIRPAGTSTLTCYLLPYLQVSIMELLHINYPHIFNFGFTGLLRSMLTAFIVIWIVGLMEKKRLRLQL